MRKKMATIVLFGSLVCSVFHPSLSTVSFAQDNQSDSIYALNLTNIITKSTL